MEGGKGISRKAHSSTHDGEGQHAVRDRVLVRDDLPSWSSAPQGPLPRLGIQSCTGLAMWGLRLRRGGALRGLVFGGESCCGIMCARLDSKSLYEIDTSTSLQAIPHPERAALAAQIV